MFRIREDEKFGKFVGTVKATDDDVDKTSNGKVTYSFARDDLPFKIKPTTGLRFVVK